MLQKPKRGWYSVPGGKMETGESIKETTVREFYEETGLKLIEPELRSTFTFVVEENEAVQQEWMLFTFYCENYEGELVEHCDEGVLEWVPVGEVLSKPMAEGDLSIYKHILSRDDLIYGTFTYTPEYQLIKSRIDPSNT